MLVVSVGSAEVGGVSLVFVAPESDDGVRDMQGAASRLQQVG